MLCNYNDQIALKHSLNQGRSNEKHHYRYIVIIRPHNYHGNKKYALISRLWPRYPKFLFIIPVCVYMKNEQTTGVCKQR